MTASLSPHIVFSQSINDFSSASSAQLDFARIKAQRSLYQKLVWYALFIAVAFIGLGAGMGLVMLGRAMSLHCENACAAAQGDEGCFNFRQWLGITVQVYMVPIGVLALGAAIVELGQLVCHACC